MHHHTDIPSSFYRISLKALIRNEDGDILVNREKGRDHFSLPGGGWDHGETDIQCLQRELFEELGFNGEFTAVPVLTSREPIWMPTKKAWLLWIVYEVVPDSMQFIVGEESEEIKFVTPEYFKAASWQSERMIYEYTASMVH